MEQWDNGMCYTLYPMKKIIPILSLLLFTGCSSSELNYQDLEASLIQSVEDGKEYVNTVQENVEYMTEDAKTRVEKIKLGIEKIEEGKKLIKEGLQTSNSKPQTISQ